MSEHSDEFKEQYRDYYGYHFSKQRPDFSRCAEEVHPSERAAHPHQCTRKNGHGPHGAWCKQHDPDAVKAKRAERQAEWQAEWIEKKRKRDFEQGCQAAIRQIAAGHNDPRGLAQSLIDKLEGREGEA